MNANDRVDSQVTRQSGFSLIEILIAIVIASIGLLGLASMQATGLKNNQSAYQRSQATVLAYDYADRMRANISSISSYLSGFSTRVIINDDGSFETEVVAESGVEQAGEEELMALAGCHSTDGCTNALLARNDLLEWNSNLQAALPGAIGIITLAGDIYTIRIGWDDDRDGSVNGGDPISQVSFQL
jgi:type IV pilus assembly protein PilV